MTRPTSSPQHLVDHALETSASPECVVIVQDETHANLRWANNTLTTNGVGHDVGVTVIAFRDGATASVSSTAASTERVTVLVEAADAAVRRADPAEDRNPLVTGEAAADWDEAPAATSIEVYDVFAKALGEEFERAEAEQRVLYGFVNHEVATTYLGSSTGLRRRHVQRARRADVREVLGEELVVVVEGGGLGEVRRTCQFWYTCFSLQPEAVIITANINDHDKPQTLTLSK